MNYLKKATLILFLIFISCSNDDSIVSNGFTVNGTFYATDFAKASNDNPYHLTLSSPLNESAEDGQFGGFYLISGGQGDGIPLATATYTTNHGPNSIFGIDGYHPIHFQNNSQEGNFAYSAYWYLDDEFQSGTVTINTITTLSENGVNPITQINLNYEFRWNGVTIIGNYSGDVHPN